MGRLGLNIGLQRFRKGANVNPSDPEEPEPTTADFKDEDFAKDDFKTSDSDAD